MMAAGGPPPPPLLLPTSGPIQAAFAAPLLFSAGPLPGPATCIVTPRPSKKMKTVNWSKLPTSAVTNKRGSVWEKVLEMDDIIKVNYENVESLFCQNTVEPTEVAPGGKAEKPKSATPTEITLLDSRKSMNINIFLRQFKMAAKDIVELIRLADESTIGIERLVGLQKILPQPEDVEVIKAYDGSPDALGGAERFYHCLLQLSAYDVRINIMIMKSELPPSIAQVRANLSYYKDSAVGIMNNRQLNEFLRYVLHTGNFINAGRTGGNAGGFKVSSLQKLIDTKANKPRMTLLHYVVSEARLQNSGQTLSFVPALQRSMSGAAKVSLDAIEGELNGLAQKVKKAAADIEKAGSPDMKQQFSSFLELATGEVDDLRSSLNEVKGLCSQMAVYLCEDERAFQAQECISSVCNFLEKVQQCDKENEQRRIQEEKAEQRRKAREEADQKKERQPLASSKAAGSNQKSPDSDMCLIDRLLGEIKRGQKLHAPRPLPGGKENAPAAIAT